MRTIIEAKQNIAKVIGKQKVKDTQYRMMNYTLSFEVEAGLILHNVITGKMVLLSKEEQKLVSETIVSNKNGLIELIQDYYLVPVEFDEAKYVNQIRNILRVMDNNRTIVSYTILPTTYCNARCYYCYESNIVHKHMSEETADAVVEYIKNNHGNSKVKLRWFGGEPTIGAARINQICSGLERADISYESSMISNGFLFDTEMVEEAVNRWKLQRVQITLDGTEEIYNKTKAYSNAVSSPYQRVMRNIGLLLEAGVSVLVRINLSNSNEENVEELIQDLKTRFESYDNLHLYLNTLYEGKGFEPVHYKNNEKETLIEKGVSFDRRIRQWNKAKKIKVSLPSLRFRSCMADSRSSVIINPDGTLARCEHYLDSICGNIYEGRISEKEMTFWREYETLSCSECKLYPFCLGLENCTGSAKCEATQKDNRIDTFLDIMEQKYIDFLK